MVCPFCLIGIRQLLFALEKYAIIHPNYPIIPEIRCLPYQLNWYLSETPVDRIKARRKRFGVERADAVQRSMTEKTAAVGLN